MAHDLIDGYAYFQRPTVCRFNGTVYQTFNHVFKDSTTRQPASISNPKVLGYRFPSSWYLTRLRWETSEGSLIWRNPDGDVATAIGQLSSYEQPHQLADAQLDPSLADWLLRNVLSSMVEDDVAFNAFLLQGKQSLKMVANLATGIAHGVDNLMTAEFKQPKSFRKFLGNATNEAISNFSGKYLEYLYGWKPLADDVTNAFQSLLDGYTGPEQKQFRLKVRKSKRTKREFQLLRPADTYWTSSWLWRQTMTRENRAKVVLHYEFPSQAGDMLPTMTPFGTAWEAAPWSFVLDWFIPVGDWIGAMEATQYAIYMRDAVVTQSVKVTSQPAGGSSFYLKHTVGCVMDSEVPPRVSGQSFIMTREVLGSVAVLDRIRFPSFTSKFGLPQASQALALLSQVTKKWF